MKEAAELVARCSSEYGGSFTPGDDLPSGQTVAGYDDATRQRKYIHMYLPKHIGLWRAVRKAVGDDPAHAFWSIGAGPLLDAIGWFWPSGRTDDRRVVAVDVLSWNGVRQLPEWESLAVKTIGPHEYIGNASFLPSGLQPQLEGRIPRLVAPNEIDREATVLFPFILNHVFGSAGPAQDAGILATRDFVSGLLQRGCRVIVADMHVLSSTMGFWDIVRRVAPELPSPQNLAFDPTDLAAFYSDGQGIRRTSIHMRQAAVAVLDRSGGRFL